MSEIEGAYIVLLEFKNMQEGRGGLIEERFATTSLINRSAITPIQNFCLVLFFMMHLILRNVPPIF